MKAKRENHYIGMWKHPVGGFEICYRKDGKKHSEYRRDETEAKLRAEHWKAEFKDPDQPRKADEEKEHPVVYWEKQLRKIAELAISNPGDKQISDTCKAIAAAATAALRTAKYLPSPGSLTPTDGAPVQGNVQDLNTEELMKLAGVEEHDLAD